MAWMYLSLAGALEIAFALGLKQSQGFTRLWPSLFTLVTMLASFGFLAAALRTLPLGTAYAIWTGIGTLGVFVLGILLLGEQATMMRLAAAGLIAGGIVLMKLSAS